MSDKITFPKDFHEPECACDLDRIAKMKASAVGFKGPYVVDENGDGLVYVDSFGFRGKYPGEDEACYRGLVKRMFGGFSEAK